MAIPLISATWEWDNVKDYNSETKTATITNALGLGEKIADITLLSEQHMRVIAGEDRLVAEFKIDSTDTYIDWHNGMEFFNLNADSKKISKEFD